MKVRQLRIRSAKQGVVVGVYWANYEAVDLILDSLKGCPYRVVIVVSGANESPLEWLEHIDSRAAINHWEVFRNNSDAYELGAFRKVLECTDLDEFLFLQDSFEIIDQSFLDQVFTDERSVALGPTFFHYAGKWKRSVLKDMEIPDVRSKRESVHWEHTFSRLYWERVGPDGVWVFDPAFDDGQAKGIVQAFGRDNLLLENDFYRKRKGDWGQRPI